MKKKHFNPGFTKKMVDDLPLTPFRQVLAYTRHRDGRIVSPTSAYWSPPRVKREWSFEGTHDFEISPGVFEKRPGSYVPKMARL